MNHRSLRASPAGSTALWCHCSIRWVLVKVPVLLGVRGGREEEHLGRDVLGAQLAGLDLRAVLPPRRALDQREVAHDEPVELRHPQPLHARVRRADGRVLAEQEVALAVPVELRHDGVVGAVAAGQARQVVEAEVVAPRVAASPHHALSRLTM